MNTTQNDKDDPGESQQEKTEPSPTPMAEPSLTPTVELSPASEVMLTLDEENLYTFRDPFYKFSMSFPGKFSFLLDGYDRYSKRENDSPDRSFRIFLDTNNPFDFVNYICVTGQVGPATHGSGSSDDKMIKLINDAGQEATLYYTEDENTINFEYITKNGYQYVRGYFEADFYKNNEEIILSICKSVQNSR
jgi:hypothetical protein